MTKRNSSNSSKTNMYMYTGMFALLLGLWIVLSFIPALFYQLFDTIFGNIVVLGFVFLAMMHNKYMGCGLLVVALVLWRFGHMGMIM